MLKLIIFDIRFWFNIVNLNIKSATDWTSFFSLIAHEHMYLYNSMHMYVFPHVRTCMRTYMDVWY
jgi:hypothetical protein